MKHTHKLGRKYKRRLLKLAEFLDGLPRSHFTFNRVGNCNSIECGSTACAVGWCPKVFPVAWKWMFGNSRLSAYNYIICAEEFFSLQESEAGMLFTPKVATVKPLSWLDDDSKPAEVAANIRLFVKNFEEIRTKVMEDGSAKYPLLGKQGTNVKYPLE